MALMSRKSTSYRARVARVLAPLAALCQGLEPVSIKSLRPTIPNARADQQCKQHHASNISTSTEDLLLQCVQYCVPTNNSAAAGSSSSGKRSSATAASDSCDPAPGFCLHGLSVNALQQALSFLQLAISCKRAGLSDLLGIRAGEEQLASLTDSVREQLNILPSPPCQPPAPTAAVLDRDLARFFQQRQDVALATSGCSAVKAAIKGMPKPTPEMVKGASPEVRDPCQWQLLQVRGPTFVWYMPNFAVSSTAAPHDGPKAPDSDSFGSSGSIIKVVMYASDELIAHVASQPASLSTGSDCKPDVSRTLKAAAQEAAVAGGLQDAAVSKYGEAGPYVAPVLVDVQPCPQLDGLLNHGYDCQVLMAFPFCRGGDGLQFATKEIAKVLEAAATAQQAPAQQQPGIPSIPPPLPSAERTAQGVVAILEDVLGGMSTGLEKLHRLGAIACDNKLVNVVPNVYGRRHGALIDAEAVTLCGAGECVWGGGLCTPRYAAPEQMKPAGADDASMMPAFRCHLSDVWSLGSAAKDLLECAVDLATYHGQEQVAALLQQGGGPAHRLHLVQAKCLKDSPVDRPVMADVCEMLGLQL